MKKTFLSLALVVATAFAFGQTISGTPHDMSSATWNTGAASNKLCGTCHTPHNALAVAEAPLWSHTLTTASYTMYTNAVSSTFNATPGIAPDGNSKLCLSCHDGTVALNDYVGSTPNTTMMTGSALVGTDLSNDHPVSFTYDAALVTADGGGLKAITTNVTALGGTIEAKMLFGGKMQCASCHNPHNNQYTSFQRMDNTNSELCLACHNK